VKVWPTPSEAIKNDACAICLGGGVTYQVDLGALNPCTGCGGTGLLSDMLARNCDDPHCPEHGGAARHLHLVPPPVD